MIADLVRIVQIVLIDIVLAGDNAVVIGTIAATLATSLRGKVMMFGIGAAILARIVISMCVVWLMFIPGIRLIGGALLLWVAWKMWKDIQEPSNETPETSANPKTLWAAIGAIVMADLSMSLDNVLGVAGAANGHFIALGLGLLLSMILMGGAATVIASMINKRPWIAYIGLGLIVFVAVKMIFEGFF